MMFRYRGVEFGGQHGEIIVEDAELSTAELRGDDTPRPQGDGDITGRQWLGGRTWALDLWTNRRSLAEAYATEAKLAGAWEDPAVRQQAGILVPLSYNLGDKWRRVYGKPGRYAGPKPDVRARLGAGKITADFKVSDPYFYDEDEQHTQLTIVPSTTGGLVAPLVAPLTSVRSSAPRAGLVRNDGDRPTPLRAVFHGPVVDPWVRAAAGWEIGLLGSFPWDVTITVDALAGTVTRSDGAAVHGILTRATRLSTAKLPAGPSELTFGGKDQTGTAKVDLYWRNAHASIGGGGVPAPAPAEDSPVRSLDGGSAETTNYDYVYNGGAS